MESLLVLVLVILLFALCIFCLIKLFIATFRMYVAEEKITKKAFKDKKYHYILEIFYPFSLFKSKDQHVKERRHHFLDVLFYIGLFFLAIVAFMFVFYFWGSPAT